MNARTSTRNRAMRSPLAARAVDAASPRIRLATLLVAALLLTLAAGSRAEAYVYWVGTYGNPGTVESATAIGRANLDGSGVKKEFVLLPRGGGSGGVAVDEAHLYWANEGSIGRANLDGTGANQSFIADVNVSSVGAPSGVAVDEEHIYWVSKFSDDPTGEEAGGGAIGRANLDGTGVDESFITGLTFPAGALAVDDSHLYWTSCEASPFCELSRDRIGRANLDGTGVEESFITGAGGNGLAVDDTYLWWAYSDRFAGGIVRANLDGTGSETVIGGGEDFFPYGVAVDDTHVYWRGGFSSTAGLPIGRTNLDGSRAEHEFLTGTGESIFGGLAVDELPFRFGDVKRNRKRGTAKLTLIVPGPGTLKLAKTGRVKRAKERAEVEGSVKLPVKPKGKAKKKLNRRGKAKVRAKVTYIPEGGEPNTQTKRVRLVKRR